MEETTMVRDHVPVGHPPVKPSGLLTSWGLLWGTTLVMGVVWAAGGLG